MDASREVALSVNGEIYNYIGLAEEVSLMWGPFYKMFTVIIYVETIISNEHSAFFLSFKDICSV